MIEVIEVGERITVCGNVSGRVLAVVLLPGLTVEYRVGYWSSSSSWAEVTLPAAEVVAGEAQRIRVKGVSQ